MCYIYNFNTVITHTVKAFLKHNQRVSSLCLNNQFHKMICFEKSWNRESITYFCINLYPIIFIIYIFKFKFLFYKPKVRLSIYIISAKCQMLDMKGLYIMRSNLSFCLHEVDCPLVYQVFCYNRKIVMSWIPKVLCHLGSLHICCAMWHPWPLHRTVACPSRHLQQLSVLHSCIPGCWTLE